MNKKQPNGVSGKIVWPPEKAFKYDFRNELEIEIPLVENEREDVEGR